MNRFVELLTKITGLTNVSGWTSQNLMKSFTEIIIQMFIQGGLTVQEKWIGSVRNQFYFILKKQIKNMMGWEDFLVITRFLVTNWVVK